MDARRKRTSKLSPTSQSARARSGKDPDRFPLTTSRAELLVEGSDREFRRLVHGLFGFLARHEQIRSGHAKLVGLPGIEYTVLISIAHLSVEGDVNIRTIADHLHLSGAFITSTVRRLLARGMVCKKTDVLDRRRVTLTVSTKGHAALERLAPVQRQVNDLEFGGINRKDFNFLVNIVPRLINSADQAIAFQRYLVSARGSSKAVLD